MPPMSAVPVLVVEDNPLLLEGIVSMLRSAEGLRVVAAAKTSDEALRHLPEAKPQLVLLDAALPHSRRVLGAVRERVPDAKVVVMALLPPHEDVVEFVRAGASGFVLKDASTDEFVRTLKAVAGGDHVLPDALVATLFTHVAQTAVSSGKQRRVTRMTKREREVTELIADGRSNKEIAARLHIAAKTVKSHVHNILEKLALHTRLEVAAYAHAERRKLE